MLHSGEFAGQLIKNSQISALRVQEKNWMWKSYLQALVGRPSLHVSDACMIILDQGALRRNCRQKACVRPLFLHQRVFLFSRNSRVAVLGYWYLWHLMDWRCKPETLGRSPFSQVGVEVFNVGGWLTHGDLALDAQG